MTLLAAVLLLISASTHASWNFLGKSLNRTPAFMAYANTLGSFWLIPVLFFYGKSLAHFTPAVWLLLVLTGICQAVYFFALTGAYRSGDLSVAYPLARSAPVILVAVISILLGRLSQISHQSLVGMVLVGVGGVLLPMTHFKDLRLKNYVNLSCLLALTAALCTAGYSLIDDQALRLLHQTPGITTNTFAISIVYSLIEAWSCSFFLVILILCNKTEREHLNLKKINLGQAVIVGALIIAAYTLVLVAMNFVRNVSYVVAFRQVSIIIGAILGVVLLKEPHHPPKLAGLLVMFVGLVLVGTG